MGRLNQLSTWQRLSAIGVVTAVIVGVLVWLRPDDRQPAPPFPEIGYVQEGDDIPHTVVHRTVEPHIGDGSVVIADQETLTWDGSMALDDTETGGYDRDGRYRRRVVTTSQPVGIEIAHRSWLVWHVDVEDDGTVDLAVFRRPLPSDEPRLAADAWIGYLHQPYEEYIVGRSGTGQALATSFSEGGLHSAVCDSGVFPDAGPLPPEEAVELLETDDRTIWCTRPMQRPEPLEPGPSEDEAGEAEGTSGDGEEQVEGLRSPRSATTRPISTGYPGQEQEDEPVVIDLTETPCEIARRELDETVEELDRVAENPEEELAGPLRELEDLAETIEELGELGEDPDAAREMFDELLEEVDSGDVETLLDVLDNWREALGSSLIDKIKEALTDPILDELLDKLNQGDSPEQIKELQKLLILGWIEVLTGQKTLLELNTDIINWAADTAREVAEIIGNLGADLEGMDEEECEEHLEQQICNAHPGLTWCGREPELDPRLSPDRVSSNHKGEPHFTTFDGLSYDFQAVGEYTTVRGEDLEVQARYSNLREGSVSVTVAAAARLPGSDAPISVYVEGVTDDGWTVHLGDDPFLVAPGRSRLGEYELVLDGSHLRITTDGTVGVDVFYMEANRPLFNIVGVDIEPGLSSTVTGGLLGDIDGEPSNDHRLPDGTVIPPEDMDFDTLYQVFGEAWRVKSVEGSLFSYEPGTDPSTFHNPRFPEGEVTLGDLTQAQLLRGLVPCLDGGVWIEPALSECAFDVAMMDDDLWVQTGVQSQGVLPEASNPLALPDGLLDASGGYVLWQHDDFEVRALVAGDATASTSDARLVMRALEVEADGSTTFIYPGWQDPPAFIDLPGDRELRLSAWRQVGLIATLDGSLEGVTGLATEEGREPGPEGGPGPRTVPATAVQQWATPFPTDAG